MSNILEFRVSPSRKSAPVDPHIVATAGEIVIFPGVRYERSAEVASGGPSPGDLPGTSGKRRRGAK